MNWRDAILFSWWFECSRCVSDFSPIGFELSFFSGVYSSSVGFTLAIGESAKQLVGLSGICIGIGEVFGGILFGLLGSKTVKYGRDPVFIMGFIIHLASFALIFLNLPDKSPFEDTHDISFLSPPRAWIALLCSFLLGFGDACFNTQIYSMLGGSFAKNSAAAFALFKFTQVNIPIRNCITNILTHSIFQSIAAAISFVYSSYLGLHNQMAILLVFGVIGTISFCIVERSINKKGRSVSSLKNTEKIEIDRHSE